MIIAEPMQPAGNARLEDGSVEPASISSRLVVTEKDFLGLESVWRNLCDRSADSNPTNDWEWLVAWWQVFGRRCPQTGGHGQPFVVIVERGEEIVGMFPFVSHPVAWWELRRLRPMGYAGKLEPSGLTEEPLGVWLPKLESETKAEVERQLRRAVTSGKHDCAIFRHLACEHASGAATTVRSVMIRKTKRGPGIVSLPTDWPSFRKQLSKSMRDNLPYYPRLLARAGHSFEVRICTEGFQIESAAKRLIELHRQRVREDRTNGHRDYFANDWERQMLKEGMRRLGSQGKGFIAVLAVDGQEIAAQAFLRSQDRLVVHYSGFDPAFAKYSPLLILQSEVFKGAIEQGIHEVDLLYGTAQWQTRWGAEPKEQDARTLIMSTRPASVMRAAIYAIRREIRTALVRRGIRLRLPSNFERLGTLTSAGMQLHNFAMRTASSPVMHHLIRAHR